MAYEVNVEGFSGPLDLLLHLIQRYEIDIYDIPVAEITAQYMAHIHAMQVLELDEASEYLVMAATLLALKSRMLLPMHDIEDDTIEEVDPRDELVQQLIQYKRYKQVAKRLETQRDYAILQYPRPATDLSFYMKEEQLALFDMDVTVYDMLATFEKMLQRKKWQQPLTTRVARQEIAIKDQMRTVFTLLKKMNGQADFTDLFDHRNKSALIATFLSVLELMRQQMIRIEQQQNFEALTVILVQEEWQDGYTAELDYQD